MSILKISSTKKLHYLTKRYNEAGFTILELMVVVAIIGILMAIVLPSYQDSVRKARRSDAMSALMDAANRQEQAMLDRNAYTTNMTTLGFASDPMISPEGFYSIDATISVNSYTLTATPVSTAAQKDDTRCTWFALTSTGAKTAGGTQAAQCWGQ